ASRDGIHRHNFTGFNISAMKSLITEGNLTTEEKHGLASQDRRKGLMIITLIIYLRFNIHNRT
ncbi:MAG: hypothetical protein D8B54_03140, partial [Catonella sp.]